jgi:hypothetical protein
LRNPALHLPLDQHRLQHPAAIIDTGIGGKRRAPGGGVDLDLGDVDAIGEGRRGVKRAFRIEAVAKLLSALCQLESVMLRSVPVISNTPPRYWMSASAASRTCAARRFPLSITASSAPAIAPPTDIVEREATAAALGTSSSLSPCATSMSSAGMPR